ncbi:type II toxin-antitoxin system Phd/YefM family antitoxin [Nitrosomonas oligotropha]|uniref:Antitoxin n=1 Tax=Nitrosomonas oligotropha TaxID=42354 RepID=A0A1H8JCM6_9PROT|nr:antitoxin YefM [Nitrosomonas oligotropha]SEN78520.1 antitoxin YefM [Nitrosomonas oligotropha]
MNTINYSTICTNLAQTMKRVCNDHVSVIITWKEGAPVVLISLEDYQALEAGKGAVR